MVSSIACTGSALRAYRTIISGVCVRDGAALGAGTNYCFPSMSRIRFIQVNFHLVV